MSKVTFPVTITGINVTDRSVKLPSGKGPFDKFGITIRETNVIDENGQNIIIPQGAWLNGLSSPGKADTLSVGTVVPISISAKPKADGGGFWYNFVYFPKDVQPTQAQAVAAQPAPVAAAPVAQPAPAPVNVVTREEFDALEGRVLELEQQNNW